MAAGMGTAPGGSLESTLDKKFHNVTNTMDSIQGLSTWCIDNKKYHSLIVRQWIKCLKKSDGGHRLNLLYLANDIIQNCKRKNAIVYRTAFADVLPDAFTLVNTDGDVKVIRSVERILTIWDERGVYARTLIADLRNALVKEESPPETPVEQKTPVESKADLRSKIVAEFVPQALIDQLSKYKRSLEEVDLREKQLAAMRVDICSSEALKKLKDKAGGKKFSKDFEEGSAQLQEFVRFFDKQSKVGPPLLEALSNADIFYEMQYKEVKIVANAYQTFANRVSHLKRKLDSLKTTLPDLDDSPIPSPSADAPSPTGSESPFHGMDLSEPIADPDLDGSAMDDDAEPPAPSPLSSPGGSPVQEEVLGGNDNREVEDMDLSEEEVDSSGIIFEEQTELSPRPEVSAPICAKSEPSGAKQRPAAQVAPPAAAPAAAAASVDVGKIGSILNSLNSAMKTAGPPAESLPAAAPAAPPTTLDASSLVSILSKVDMSPTDLLSALSKVQGHGGLAGISSLLGSSAASASSDSPDSPGSTPPPSAVPSRSPSLPFAAPVPSSSAAARPGTNARGPSQASSKPASALARAVHKDAAPTKEAEETSASAASLESKIHNFLQGNPAFNAFDFGPSTNSSAAAGPGRFSPAAAADAREGTPVRDEGGGTPTQDEAMDKPTAGGQSKSRQNPNSHSQQQTQNGQIYQPYVYGKREMSERGAPTPAAHYQPLRGPAPGERAPGGAGGFQGPQSERSWYGDAYPEGGPQRANVYGVAAAPAENKTSGMYPYRPDQTAEQQGAAAAGLGFFGSSLPPLPQLPPPPRGMPPPPQRFEAPPPSSSSANSLGMMPPEQQQPGPGDTVGPRGDSVISGMVVHDHQHKSPFQPAAAAAEDLGPRNRDDPDYFRDERRPHGGGAPSFFQDGPYHQPDNSHYRPGSPPQHFPRVRGRLSPSEDPYYAHNFQRHSPPPPHFAPRRPPPLQPRHEMHHPGMRPPHPRGPPRPPFPRFPDPRLRGKRPPGPRGGGGGGGGPMFAPKRPFLPPRY